ncbi:hypothetical protein [Streptomyces sp. NBC_01304]|uniref:hypothetical protein n=1 Tax=Streptomyces sp. NBC_01304 TaxID=2903818 RepID=UPI002E11233A|nr:hypothetical protein OG430_44140 [Streptomyces sp. NBC_01304]
MHHKTIRIATATAMAGLTLGLATTGASAAPADGGSAAAAADIVERATGTGDIAPSAPAAGTPAKSVIQTPGGAVTVTAPEQADGTLTAGAKDGSRLGFGLPVTDGVRAVKAGSGTVVYPDAGRSTDLAIQPTVDGGARTLVTLKDQAAPTTHRFTVHLPDGADLSEDGRGGYEITREVDEGVRVTVGTVEAPWAKDANGKPVETSYRLDGDGIVQTVEANEGTAFPVVADPKFTWGIVTGTAYFSKGETKKIADNGALAAMGTWALPPGLNVYVSAHAAAITTTAVKAKNAKRCIKIKFAAGLFLPDQYSGGYCK